MVLGAREQVARKEALSSLLKQMIIVGRKKTVRKNVLARQVVVNTIDGGLCPATNFFRTYMNEPDYELFLLLSSA